MSSRVGRVLQGLVAIACLSILGCRKAPVPSESASTVIDPVPEPYQEKIEDGPIEWTVESAKGACWKVTATDYYAVGGKVCSVKGYASDWKSDVAPVDLAMRWGDLATDAYEGKIKWSQSGRWYWWKYPGGTGLSNSFISQRSSNSHIIPSTDNVLWAIWALRPGDVAELSGYLVNLSGSLKGRTYTWNSSKSRIDTGAGSCEVFYVDQVTFEGSVYR